MAMQRAQDKTEQMQARAGALDELLASGALEDATLPGERDDVQSQLASAAAPAVEGPGTASADPHGASARAAGHLVSAPIPGEGWR